MRNQRDNILVVGVSAPTPNDAVQQQRHVLGDKAKPLASGGFAVNPRSAAFGWQVRARLFDSVHPHQLAKAERGCKLRRPT